MLFLGGALPLWPYAASLSLLWRIIVLSWPLLILGLPFVVSWNWLLIAPVLAGVNVLFALLFSTFSPRVRPVERLHSQMTFGERIRTGLGVALCGLPFAWILVGLEQWLSDALWSVYFPVNSSLDSIAYEIRSSWMLFAVVFGFTALYARPPGSEKDSTSPGWILKLLVGTFVVYLILHQLYLLLIAIPEWQTDIREIFPPWVTGLREAGFHLLMYTAIPVLLGGFFVSREPDRWSGFFKGLVSLVLTLAVMAWVSGMPIHYALLKGQQEEKSGRPSRAVPWYSHALMWSQSGSLKSYLQFRVGLLYRKTGKLEEARDAFTRVLVRYPNDETLLDAADEFKEKLSAEKSGVGRRVVIPGIEARTEYKSAYCVPNSLGLLLNFWGDRTGAKRIGSEITQLDRGSLVTDELHFAESRGFKALAVPLCTRDHIHRLIDAGIPVLAFIPGHVIAVFGYDEALGTLVTYDVSTFDIWDDARWEIFASDWSRDFNTLGIVVPASWLPKVRAVLGTDVEQRAEAYTQYLLSEVTGDAELRLKRLRRALGRGFSPAGWDYRDRTGDTTVVRGEDSSAADFLLTHETDEQASYDFAIDQLWRGRDEQAFGFLAKLGNRKPLTSSLSTVLAAASLRLGKSDQTFGVLLQAVPFENMDPGPAAYLLRNSSESGEDWVTRLGQELLNRDELHGDEARLAYQAWRASVGMGSDALKNTNTDDALNVVHAYLERWNPYDTLAIHDLEKTLDRKTFRPNESTDQRVWKKQRRLLALRRARLEWAMAE
mgnify:FL=1